jgi:hypothetical protein
MYFFGRLGVSTFEAMEGVGVRIPFQDFEGQFRARLRLVVSRQVVEIPLHHPRFSRDLSE